MTVAVLNITPEGGLSRYFQVIDKFSMLTYQEGQTLARRWREVRDSDAAHKLITSRQNGGQARGRVSELGISGCLR
jgi:RNA polymerase sigma-32 factor